MIANELQMPLSTFNTIYTHTEFKAMIITINTIKLLAIFYLSWVSLFFHDFCTKCTLFDLQQATNYDGKV